MDDLIKQRFLALDIFRGLALCLMIIVNAQGASSFPIFTHSDWNGFTLADLIFPSFLFAVGSSLSFAADKWSTQTNAAVISKILKRAILIFLFGYLLGWFPFFRLDEQNHLLLLPIGEIRIMGVLQRIALTYAGVALLVRFCSLRAIVGISFVFLIVYWLAMVGFGDKGNIYGITGNACTKLDLFLFTPSRVVKENGFFYEPEGVLSTLPAMINVIAGYLAGYYIRKNQRPREVLSKFIVTGFVLLCVAFVWSIVMPINKKLWTDSFAMQTVGLDLLILVCIIYLVDFSGYGKYTYFFQVLGRNTLFIYLLSEAISDVLNVYHIDESTAPYDWLYSHTFGLTGNESMGSLLFSICFMVLCWLVAYFLDKRNVYITV